ncbi:hypothetical protein H6F93_15415 [Leptolyngbya sp. FACHB-671]|uniref:hypothetical protein n=1 Tax=Leptolyngbya sp. FACHB-671 TaxID=2692812 RepID=UPI00168542FB|nr:hypothetical protein [Leptolyngbya sp. FACHB-671]MBD2068894.1 hypothetical protein [Leptolyngbya sp. FACHB-671]
MSRSVRTETALFLSFVGITLVVWVLRGIGILTFLPGLVIWLLIFLSIGAGVFDFIQRIKR